MNELYRILAFIQRLPQYGLFMGAFSAEVSRGKRNEIERVFQRT